MCAGNHGRYMLDDNDDAKYKYLQPQVSAERALCPVRDCGMWQRQSYMALRPTTGRPFNPTDGPTQQQSSLARSDTPPQSETLLSPSNRIPGGAKRRHHCGTCPTLVRLRLALALPPLPLRLIHSGLPSLKPNPPPSPAQPIPLLIPVGSALLSPTPPPP